MVFTKKDNSEKRIWTETALTVLSHKDHVQIFDLLVDSFLEIGFKQHSYAHYTLEDLEIKLYNDSVGIFKVGFDEGRKVYYWAGEMRVFWNIVRKVWEGR
tara:strand:- start:501 stop:800 length:300 start_codon:yes stop_codon:yes gene_type:complete